MKNLNLFLLLLAVATASIRVSQAQNTFPSSGAAGIGTIAPDASSLLEVKSTTKGVLIPRMTQSQRNTIATPATGLLIYQTNKTPGFYYYNGSAWSAVSGASTTLNNLSSPTAVNADLLPKTDNTNSLGSSSLHWKDVNLSDLKFSDGSIQTTASPWVYSSGNIYDNSGFVGIGTTTPAYALDVCGTIRGKEMLVATGWCDYVFDKNYLLRSIPELEEYIQQNKHLPDIPSAIEVEANGIKVGQMSSAMMKKIEELTLYIIDLQKQVDELKQELKSDHQ